MQNVNGAATHHVYLLSLYSNTFLVTLSGEHYYSITHLRLSSDEKHDKYCLSNSLGIRLPVSLPPQCLFFPTNMNSGLSRALAKTRESNFKCRDISIKYERP